MITPTQMYWLTRLDPIIEVGNKLYDLAVEWMDELKPARANKGGEK